VLGLDGITENDPHGDRRLSQPDGFSGK
jgi:hypothetical protein